MPHLSSSRYLLVLVVLAQSSVVQAAGDVPPNLSGIWKVGDSWELQVEAYARDQVGLQKPPARYSIVVRVAGTEKSDGLDYSHSAPSFEGFQGVRRDAKQHE
jgi:hypothetical protein